MMGFCRVSLSGLLISPFSLSRPARFQWCDNTKFRRCYERDAAKHGYSGRRLWDLAYQACARHCSALVVESGHACMHSLHTAIGALVYHFHAQASVAELDRTIEQLQIRVEQNGDSQEDFERTCERMRSDLQTSYEVDLRRAA
jgi:hypothetical protein